MVTTLLTTGLACIIAAIVGGGFKAFGIEIPLLQSGKREALLAVVGLILVGAAYLGRAKPAGSRWEMSAFEVGIDRFGGIDYNNGSPARSLQECSDTCLADTRCMSFSFNTQSNQCWLKGDVPLRIENRIFTSAVKIAKP